MKPVMTATKTTTMRASCPVNWRVVATAICAKIFSRAIRTMRHATTATSCRVMAAAEPARWKPVAGMGTWIKGKNATTATTTTRMRAATIAKTRDAVMA